MLTAVEIVGAVALVFAWCCCGPILVVILFGLPAEALSDRLRRRRERRKLPEPAALDVSEKPAPPVAAELQHRG